MKLRQLGEVVGSRVIGKCLNSSMEYIFVFVSFADFLNFSSTSNDNFYKLVNIHKNIMFWDVYKRLKQTKTTAI